MSQVYFGSTDATMNDWARPGITGGVIAQLKIAVLNPGMLIQVNGRREVTDNDPLSDPLTGGNVRFSTKIILSQNPNDVAAPLSMSLDGWTAQNLTPDVHHVIITDEASMVYEGPPLTNVWVSFLYSADSDTPAQYKTTIENTQGAYGLFTVTVTDPIAPDGPILPLSSPPLAGSFSQDDLHNIVMATDNVGGSTIVGNAGNDWRLQGVANLNGNIGEKDVILQSGSGQIWEWLMNGSQIVTSQSIGNPGSDWHIVGMGDFNGDGKTDILLQADSTGQVWEWLMNGSQIMTSQSVGNPGVGERVVGVNDSTITLMGYDASTETLQMNGSGGSTNGHLIGSVANDTFYQNGSTGAVSMQIGSNQPTAIGNPGASWQAKTVGFDNDHADMIFQATDGEVWFWNVNLTDGNITNSHELGSPGSSWNVVGAGNFDATGLDVVMQSSSGQVWEWQTNGGQITSSEAVGNPGVDWTATGVLNDTISFHSSSGNWAWDMGANGQIISSHA